MDPFSAGHFRVEIDGIAATSFSEVSGIEAGISVVEYRSGNDKTAGSRKLPGEASFQNTVLKRGLTSDLSLWAWMQQALQGDVVRKNMSVVLLSDSEQELLRFNVKDAWPVKWSVSELQTEGNGIATETLEITHEGLSVVA